VHWEKLYGDTADIAQANGEKTEQGIIVAGLRIWF
jgi:copper resistance protein B